MPSDEPIEVTLNYLSSSSPHPVVHLTRPPEGTPRDTTEVARHRVAMHDARRAGDPPSLDAEGFERVHHETAVDDLWDAERVRERYWPEMEALVARATGAARVVAFDHNVRSYARARRGSHGAQRPVKFAHNDYTARSGPQRVRDLLPAEAERLLARRFCVINVWKPIRGPVLQTPLAVCDARSISPAELVETDLVYADRVGEVYSLAFGAAQRWSYFPRMRADEALLIKCYDSAEDGRARFTAHSAFDDPRSPPGAPSRESIEVRTLAFF